MEVPKVVHVTLFNAILIAGINVILLYSGIRCSAQNIFSNTNDIELNAIKLEDNIQQNKGYMPLYQKDGWILDAIFPEISGVPDSLTEVSINYMYLNYDQALLQAYKSKLIGEDLFKAHFNKINLGTSEFINEYVKTFVIVVSGKSSGNKQYYLIDTNNDYDFSNEEILPVNSKKWTNHTHKIQFERVIDKKIRKDKTWISLSFTGEKVMFRFDEYTLSNFQFDSVQYQIKSFPSREGIIVNYGSPCFFEISNSKNSTIQVRNFGEYIKLNNSLYKITCSEDGRKIKLSKNIYAKENGSTQYGMSPIPFQSINLKGDSVNFPDDFKHKIVLLDFWATYCAPCIRDIKTIYPKLYRKYGNNKFEIVGVANNTKSDLLEFVESNKINWVIIPDAESQTIQKLYNVYAFPTLFLINHNGKIIAKDEELRGEKLELILKEYIE